MKDAVVAYVGLVCLAAGMHRHAREITRLASATAKRCWQALGWLLLGASLLPVARDARPGIALTGWIGMLAALALIVAVLLAIRPRLLAWSVPVAILVALAT